MNILFIMADQWRGDCGGFAGNPVVQTPNLDHLASSGTVFEKVFAQSPICGPSRTCIFTGQYVHEHGVWWNGVPYNNTASLLPEILKAAGYQTAIIGKLHYAPSERSFGFDHKELHEEILCDHNGLNAYHQFLASQSPPAAGPSESTTWTNKTSSVGICTIKEELEETHWVADRCCEYLRGQASLQGGQAPSPFFLFASFVRPHSPYNPLSRFADLYRNTDVTPPVFETEEWDRLPPRIRATAESWGWDTLGLDDFREVRRNYYALCTQVDESIGKILTCLEETGQKDETLIVFCSDHGDFLGEHGLLFKEHLYDGALRVPLIISDPRKDACPPRYPGLVQTIDIMPTILEWAGVPVPPSVSGKSLVPVLENSNPVHRAEIFSEFVTHCVNSRGNEVKNSCRDTRLQCVRTDEWKYIHYHGEIGELYHINEDPAERHNLVEDDSLQDIQKDLQSRLAAGLKQVPVALDPGEGNPYFGDSISATQ